jgi:splicing factor 3B subunit 1
MRPTPRRAASRPTRATPSPADDLPRAPDDDGLPKRSQRIIDREDDYRRRRLNQIISPERRDPFAAGETTPDPSVRTYADVMRDAALKKKKEDLLREIAKKKKEEEEEREGEEGCAGAASRHNEVAQQMGPVTGR